MSYKICLLGNSGSYTKMVAKSFDDLNIEYSLILEVSKRKNNSVIQKILSYPNKIYNYFDIGKYKGLSKYDIFTYKLFITDIINKKKANYQDLLKVYAEYKPRNKQLFTTPHVNHVQTLKIIQDNSFDIAIFAGVGIVDSVIINALNEYCLNGHPAPLPECRGGGALENTLYYDLDPAVSIHYGTAGIDEGEILRVTPVVLSKKDTFQSISLKLTTMCANELAEVTNSLLNGVTFNTTKSDGKLHYWKNCNKDIQKKALKNLSLKLSSIE